MGENSFDAWVLSPNTFLFVHHVLFTSLKDLTNRRIDTISKSQSFSVLGIALCYAAHLDVVLHICSHWNAGNSSNLLLHQFCIQYACKASNHMPSSSRASSSRFSSCQTFSFFSYAFLSSISHPNSFALISFLSNVFFSTNFFSNFFLWRIFLSNVSSQFLSSQTPSFQTFSFNHRILTAS